MEDNLIIAIEAAKRAGKLLKDGYETEVKINSSEGKDIKLQSDLDSEKIIFEFLNENSDISILSEEFGYVEKDTTTSLRWIIDPLDGSLNYSRHLFINCVSIGLWDNNTPVLGVIYDFIHDELLTGVVGDKAYLNDIEINTSNVSKKSDSIICTGFPVYSDFNTDALSQFVVDLQEFKKIRLLGSAAISLSLVAKGVVEAYKEDNIAIWDVAAGISIILAAGGKCEFSNGRGKNLLNVFAQNGSIR